MKRLLLLSGLILSFSGIACRKDEPATNPDFYCTQNKSPAPDSLFKLLQGRWKLYGEYCGECSKPGVNLFDGKSVVLIFSKYSTLQLIENGQSVGTAKFSIVPNTSYFETYTIKTDPAVSGYVYGYILTCNGRIGFADAYRDGADYYFERYTQ